MKPIFWVLVMLLISPFLTAALFAGSEVVEPTIDEWVQFLGSLKGATGFSALGLAAAIVQAALFVFRSHFLPLDGRKKLLIVQGLSVVAGVIALRMQNFDWASAFMHANTLGAVQVFGHQLYKQFTDIGDKYAIPPR